MSEYRGVIRSAIQYFGEAAERTTYHLVIVAALTPVFLVPLLVSDYAVYAIFTFIGMASYFAHIDLDGGSGSVKEHDEATHVKRAITIVIAGYYNALLFLSVSVGAFVATYDPAFGIAAATVFPALDGESYRMGWPFNLTTVVWVVIVLLAKVAIAVERTRSYGEDLEDVLEVISAYGLQEEIVMRIEQTKRSWI